MNSISIVRQRLTSEPARHLNVYGLWAYAFRVSDISELRLWFISVLTSLLTHRSASRRCWMGGKAGILSDVTVRPFSFSVTGSDNCTQHEKVMVMMTFSCLQFADKTRRSRKFWLAVTLCYFNKDEKKMTIILLAFNSHEVLILFIWWISWRMQFITHHILLTEKVITHQQK